MGDQTPAKPVAVQPVTVPIVKFPDACAGDSNEGFVIEMAAPQHEAIPTKPKRTPRRMLLIFPPIQFSW